MAKPKIAVVHLGSGTYLALKRDIILGVHASLDALGYDSVISHNYLDKKHLNLVIGFDMAKKNTWLQLRQKKVDYMVYETEIIHDGKLNFRPTAELDLSNDYLPALAAAQLVMSPFKYVVDTLNGLNINTAYTRWGYVPELDEVTPRSDELKGIDGYFFGMLTKTRRQLLQSMVDRGLKIKATAGPSMRLLPLRWTPLSSTMATCPSAQTS